MLKQGKKFYGFKKYDTKSRWVSYWHQIDEVLKFMPTNVLEVGSGNQTVTRYLRDVGIKVTTLDIDKKLNPDVVGSVLSLPFSDNYFDVVLCCEVLEHLPFDNFTKALGELSRVSKKGLVLSLPHFAPPVKILFKIPFLKEKQWAVKIPFPKEHPVGLEHCWEIGKKSYPLSKIKTILSKHFEVIDDFIPFENQYYHFFILKKEIKEL